MTMQGGGMGHISWITVAVAFVFDIMAFGLALGAMSRGGQAHADYESTTGNLSCKYTQHTSTWLAVIACVFLLIGQVIISVNTRCLCCGGTTYKPSPRYICAVILFVFSWITFFASEVFLLAGASENQIHSRGVLDTATNTSNSNMFYCKQVRKNIFAVGTTFSILAILSSILYCVLLAKVVIKEAPRQFYNGDPNMTNLGPAIGMTPYA